MVIHGKQLFVNYLFVKQFTYYSFLLNLQSKQATTMKIRLEQPSDYRKVENLTREAFWNVYRPGCYEHFVLNQFRNNPDFIPELDLVMEEDGMIIGHIMFSKAELILDDGTRCPSCWRDQSQHACRNLYFPPCTGIQCPSRVPYQVRS